jgi:short-subunit dehydrogenase
MRNVAILGASGGIGQAIALHYANCWTKLYLAGRSEELECIADQCKRKGAVVELDKFDVRDTEKLYLWCNKVTEEPLNYLYVTCGVSASVYEKNNKLFPENEADLKREIEVNSLAPMLVANRVITRKIEKQSEYTDCLRIVLISSIAALTGLPSSPGYSATKASLRTYCESLRRAFERENISVTCVIPGFVTSNMSRRYIGLKPYEVTASNAAEIITAAALRNRAEVIFPRRLALATSLLKFIPRCFQKFFLTPFAFKVLPDEESPVSSPSKRIAAEKREAA